MGARPCTYTTSANSRIEKQTKIQQTLVEKQQCNNKSPTHLRPIRLHLKMAEDMLQAKHNCELARVVSILHVLILSLK